MPHKYTYTILKHQPTLDASTLENFAVLVEGRAPNGWVVFLVGRTPMHSDKLSPLGTAIAQRFPDVLTGVLNEAQQTKTTSQGILDRFSQLLCWNFHASKPATIQDDDSIDGVGFKLFAQHVAHANELLTRVSPHSGPVQ